MQLHGSTRKRWLSKTEKARESSAPLRALEQWRRIMAVKEDLACTSDSPFETGSCIPDVQTNDRRRTGAPRGLGASTWTHADDCAAAATACLQLAQEDIESLVDVT